MEQRKLGRSPLQVSALGLGLMSMSGVYGNADDAQSIALIHHALERGVNFLDSADMYGWGHNEELLGKALKGKREQAMVSTKFGQTKGADGKQGVDGSPAYVQKACEASLKRLGIETIDLYYQHRVDPNTPIEDTVGAMAELVTAGKVRYLGLSEAAPDTIRRAHAVHPITALQTEYSLWSREPEAGILDTCRALGIGFVAYSPLGRGFLTGRYQSAEDLAENDWRRANPRFQGENFARNLALVDKVKQLAAQKGCTPAQLAIAWLLARGNDIVPIPGSTKAERVAENAASAHIALTSAEMQQLDAVGTMVAGERYPEGGMRAVNR